MREHADAHPCAQELFDEQRIACRALGDLLHELGWERVSDEGANELGGFDGRKRRQVEELSRRAPVRGIVEHHRTRACDNQPAGEARRASCSVEKREQVSRCPVDVLHEPNGRRAGCQCVEPLEPGAKEPVTILCQAAPASSSTTGSHGCPQGFCHDVSTGRLDACVEESWEEIVRVARRPNEVADRLERRQDVRLEPRPQHATAGSCDALGQRLQQTGLADAGWSDDDDPPGTAADGPQERRQLALPTERRGVQRAERPLARAFGVHPDDSPCRHRLGLALQGERRESLELGHIGNGQRCHVPDDDRRRVGRGLEARSDIDGIPRHGPALGSRLTVDRLAAVDTDP